MRASHIISGACLVAAIGAQAAQVTSSTADAVSFHDCAGGSNGCSEIGPLVQADYGGHPGGASASAFGQMDGMGQGKTDVSLTGDDGAPIVHGFAASNDGARVNTTTFALQRYTYTGVTPTTRTFGGTLTYRQSITGDYPGANGNGVNAGIDVFELSSPTVDAGTTAQSNFSALAFPEFLPGYADIANDAYSASATTSQGVGTVTATVTLQPGETVWVDVFLSTPAPNGDVVDASHTFVTGWNDSSNLVAASTVPELDPKALWGAGLTVVLLASRRQRRTPS